MLKSVTERLAEIRQEFLKNTERTDGQIVALFGNYLPKWSDCVGELLQMGTVVEYGGIKYRVMQTVTPMDSQPPNGDGMLAIYRPYRESASQEWLYGEYIGEGWHRTENGVEYVAMMAPPANIYPPSQVPAVWREVTSEE